MCHRTWFVWGWNWWRALRLDRGTGTCQGLEIFIVSGSVEQLSAVYVSDVQWEQILSWTGVVNFHPTLFTQIQPHQPFCSASCSHKQTIFPGSVCVYEKERFRCFPKALFFRSWMRSSGGVTQLEEQNKLNQVQIKTISPWASSSFMSPWGESVCICAQE